jgi:hypothetical protein
MAAISPMAGILSDGNPPSRMPNSTLDAMMKPSGFQANFPILSPPSVSTTRALNMTMAPQDRQQDAQHQREVTRPHARALAHRVGGGAPGEGSTDRAEHQTLRRSLSGS